MYNYLVGKAIYLLAKNGNNLHPLVKVSTSKRGIIVMGLTPTHKGMYTHAEKYAELSGNKIDKTRGHLHFYDTTAPLNEYDKTVLALGGKAGLRGGCSSTPPLDDLKGYMYVCGLGFSLNEVRNTKAKAKYLKETHFIIDLNDYKNKHIYVDTYLYDKGNRKYVEGMITKDEKGEMQMVEYIPKYDLQRFDYIENSPNIIFTLRTNS
jgi:ribosomal protein L14E/L6E/L27E